MPRDGACHVPAERAGARGAQRQVDVLVVGEVGRVEDADAPQQVAAQQRGAARHCRHRPVVAPHLRSQHTEVAIARAAKRVDGHAGGIHAFFVAEEQGAAEQPGLGVCGRGVEQRLEPSLFHFHVVVDHRHEIRAGGERASQRDVVRRSVALVAGEAKHRHVREVALEERSRPVGGAVVDHDDLDARAGPLRPQTPQAVSDPGDTSMRHDDRVHGGRAILC